MSRAAVSMLVFGIYLGTLSVVLLLSPNSLLVPFGIAATNEVWIRVCGFLVGAIAYYYVGAARTELRPLFRWTVHARMMVPLVFATFVWMRLTSPMLMLFAVADVSGAIWTALSLRSDERSAT